MNTSYFTSESVSEGHPDKIADQISDGVLDAFLQVDPESKVACETFVTTDFVLVGGEYRSKVALSNKQIEEVARNVIRRIGYTDPAYKFTADSCEVMIKIHKQSPDIARGVDVGKDQYDQGAGDQGMMFGYATKETPSMMPLSLELSHTILVELAKVRRGGKQMTYLRPDSKSQVTIEYNEAGQPIHVHTVVVSTQHDEFSSDDKAMQEQITADVKNIVIARIKANMPDNISRLFDEDTVYHVNPTGKFVIGGPHGDAGLTGRKIIVDTYGGKGNHGGGAFSGKDSSKVDRSAAYATRHIAKNMVAAGIADQVSVQVAYAIGVAEPVGFYVDTYGTSNINISDAKIAYQIATMYDMRPMAIIENLGLRKPIFSETAAYGHMGRKPSTKQMTIGYNGSSKEEIVETFTWEKLDLVDKMKEAFSM